VLPFFFIVCTSCAFGPGVHSCFGLVVRSCGCAVAAYLLSCTLGLGFLFTHSYVAVYVFLLQWSLLFLPPSPPSLSSSSPFTCALLISMCTVTLFQLYLSGCLSFSFLVRSFAGSMLGKRGLSFTTDCVLAAGRVGGCVVATRRHAGEPGGVACESGDAGPCIWLAGESSRVLVSILP